MKKNLLEWLIEKEQKHEYAILWREWSIWSKCFGKVFILNGVSSTGKTTLANYLNKFGFNKVSLDDVIKDLLLSLVSNKSPEILLHRKFLSDSDLWKIFFGLKVSKNKYQIHQKEIIEEMESIIPLIVEEQFDPGKIKDTLKEVDNMICHKVQEFIASGRNAIIDTVIPNNWKMGDFFCNLNYYPIPVILVYSSLEANLNKCFSRNNFSLKNDLCDYRSPSQVIEQYFLFYTFAIINGLNLPQEACKGLERVSTIKIQNLLNEAKNHNILLLNQLYDKTDSNYVKSISLLEEIIKKTSKMLYSSSELWVLPSVKFDYLIKSEDLKMIGAEYSFEAQETIMTLLGEMNTETL